MSEQSPLLQIRFDGKAVGPGTISVSHLLGFLSSLSKALQRVGRVLQGESQSLRQGRPPRGVEKEVELNLVSLKEGSQAAVLGFERRVAQVSLPASLPEIDFGQEILRCALEGLEAVQSSDTADGVLPAGYDPGVLEAWCNGGTVFKQGIDTISFTLNSRRKTTRTSFTSDGCMRIRARISGPQVNVRTVEGRLLMADFKEHGTRCRVHPSVGEPILCFFNEAQKDQVFDSILRYVRIVGEAKEDPTSRKIASIRISDIESLPDRQDEGITPLPRGTVIPQSFWESPTLRQLARSQNVRPIVDVNALFGTWPGEKDDGFEAAIDALRHHGVKQGDQS